jgi:membrane protein implicated in regulation of membrane protease activity
MELFLKYLEPWEIAVALGAVAAGAGAGALLTDSASGVVLGLVAGIGLAAVWLAATFYRKRGTLEKTALEYYGQSVGTKIGQWF